MKRRENNYDVATLLCDNDKSKMYSVKIDVLDEIKIYFKIDGGAYKQVFGGHVRQANPLFSQEGYLLQLKCKSYGVALEETHCKTEFGRESLHLTTDTAKEIWEYIVDNYINKSLGPTGAATGYAITKTYIADIAAATPLTYINNPYTTCLDVVDLVCSLTSAIGAGATAGAHWIVDHSKNLIINTIGTHENPVQWPDWWNTDEVGSTLTQGVDFGSFHVLDKSEEFANNVILITDFRRPSYDYWTENNAALWGNDALTTLEAVVTPKVVGTHSLHSLSNGAIAGYAYYPSAQNAAWDTSKWGSPRTIPHLNFYMYKDGNITEATTYVRLFTTNHTTDYFYIPFSTWTEPDNEWIHKSIPIGPYWASSEESKQFRWGASSAGALWTNINGACFNINLAGGAGGNLYIDDLCFSGKIVRAAKNTASITANHEYQKTLISRVAMDDTCVAATDTGMAARLAYAELLRRIKLPLSITFSIELKPTMMAGQKLHVYACQKSDGNYAIDSVMRILTVQHNLGENAVTTVTATDDLINSTPISVPDQYATMMENILVNSKEAKNMRAGAEVDVLIEPLIKNY